MDADDLSGNVPSGVAYQEGDEIADLLWVDVTLHRRSDRVQLADIFGVHVLERGVVCDDAFHPVAVDVARNDAVDPFGSGPSGLPGHRVRISRSGRNWRVATLAAQGKQALQDSPLCGQ